MTAGWWGWVCCSQTSITALGIPRSLQGANVAGPGAGAGSRITDLRHPPSRDWLLVGAWGTLCSACVGLACTQPCTPSRAVLVPLWALSCSWSLAWQSCVWVVKASALCKVGGGELCDVEKDMC